MQNIALILGGGGVLCIVWPVWFWLFKEKTTPKQDAFGVASTRIGLVLIFVGAVIFAFC